MRDSVDEELAQEDGGQVKWKEYFVQLLNGDVINEVGGGIRKRRIIENEGVVSKVVKKIMGVLKKMKGGKLAGKDGIPVEMPENRRITIFDCY